MQQRHSNQKRGTRRVTGIHPTGRVRTTERWVRLMGVRIKGMGNGGRGTPRCSSPCGGAAVGDQMSGGGWFSPQIFSAPGGR